MTPITSAGCESAIEPPSDHRAVAAEASLPVGVRQDHRPDRSRPGRGRRVRLGEDPAELRLNAQRLQDVVRDRQQARLLRLADSGDGRPAVTVQTDLLKDAALVAVREVLRRRHAQLARR